tara:strand:- start:171 stop:605 length:435 start_codon:yes stop_codon:yes gene_type:complete
MLERCFDVKRINEIGNHPDVRPYIGYAELGELDFSDAVGDEKNWFLIGEYGGYILAWSAPNVREVHVFVLPEGRGKWAAQARQFTIDYAIDNQVQMLWARISPRARSVAYYARRGGMQPTGEMIYTLGSAYNLYKMELPKCRQQ